MLAATRLKASRNLSQPGPWPDVDYDTTQGYPHIQPRFRHHLADGTKLSTERPLVPLSCFPMAVLDGRIHVTNITSRRVSELSMAIM